MENTPLTTASGRTDLKNNHSKNNETQNNETIDDGNILALRSSCGRSSFYEIIAWFLNQKVDWIVNVRITL